MAITLLRQPTEHERLRPPSQPLEQARSFLVKSPCRSLLHGHDSSNTPTPTPSAHQYLYPRTLPLPVKNNDPCLRLPGLAALSSAASDAERNRSVVHALPQPATDRGASTTPPVQCDSQYQQRSTCAAMSYGTQTQPMMAAEPAPVRLCLISSLSMNPLSIASPPSCFLPFSTMHSQRFQDELQTVWQDGDLVHSDGSALYSCSSPTSALR